MNTPTLSASALVRAATCLAGAALLSACAGTHGSAPMTATQEAATYIARAKPSYAPPGPAEDPWRPYIEEASKKFDVPERWVREVMRVESGGQEFRASGVLVTSPVGAMGLMQLMPATYDEVRARYGLSDDAFDPHNNILAGTAYLREMYDAFGSPGMLAAYNGGPARLEDYLVHNRPLPAETRRYVAMIAPYIRGEWPESRSPAEQYAVNQLPDEIPAGPRYARHILVAVHLRHGYEGVRYAHGYDVRIAHGRQTVRYASNERHHGAHAQYAPVEVAEAPEGRGMHASVRMASLSVHRSGFHLVETTVASESAAGHSHPARGTRYAAVSTHPAHTAVYSAHVPAYTHESASHGCRKASRCKA